MRDEFLPYYKPVIEDDDIAAVVESMRNGWLTTGPKVKELEAEFAMASRVKHAIAVNSCTAALKLALVALGVEPGDEVVMPALTFVAGAECVKQLGAQPVFCDVDEDTLCVTVESIRSVLSPRTKVIIPMHYGGQPAGVREISSRFEGSPIAILEDAAHALGTLDDGEWPGTFSDAAAFSFYATKNITTAEGGLLLTNRDDIADRVRVLSLHGMDRDAWKRYTKGGTWRYDIVAHGYKCNMPDLAAALGISQFRKLARLQARREALARRYLDALASIPGIKPLARFASPPNKHSWCVFAVLVDKDVTGITRDDLIEELRRRNIGTSVHFIPTQQFSAYRDTRRGDLRFTERISAAMLSLPLYPGMSNADADDVIDALGEIISASRAVGRHTARVMQASSSLP
jgi:dTDP-4-amino-4,6-dideoxygalactose transaminase